MQVPSLVKKRRGIAFASGSKSGITPYNIEAITSSIQKIARSAAPIGQVMNYLPSDLTKMNKERESWINLYTRRQKELDEAKEETKKELSPLRRQIELVDEEIEQMTHRIANAQIQIFQNDRWIKDRLQKFMNAEK